MLDWIEVRTVNTKATISKQLNATSLRLHMRRERKKRGWSTDLKSVAEADEYGVAVDGLITKKEIAEAVVVAILNQA